MAVGVFKIKERPDLGGFRPRSGPVEFNWDSDHRNAPIQPWPGGVHQRTQRTDYAGTDNPSEQVLGPNFKPFTLRGSWKDKFNSPGYAIATWNAFLALVRRGNVVEVSFKSLTFFGIITDFDWEYRREYDIGYSFTVSAHKRPGADEIVTPPQPTILKDARTLSREIDERIKKDMAAMLERKPANQIAEDTSPLTEAQFQNMINASDEFQSIVSQRILPTDADADTGVRRAVASGDLLINRAKTQIDGLKNLNTGASLMYQTPLGVLGFEGWARGTSAQARLVVFDSYQARLQLEEQADPKAIAIYHPAAGENLYGISIRFYGTPENWRLIKKRNRLTSTTLAGTETLVIPEAPPQ